MTFDSFILNLRILVIFLVGRFAQILSFLARLGSSQPGMVVDHPVSNAIYEKAKLLPWHKTNMPPEPQPKTLLSALFHAPPILNPIKKIYFENNEGFYNFYIVRFRNVLFLPDWLSEWIQVNYDVFDTSTLEVARLSLFLLLIYYHGLISLRVTFYFFPTINPYVFPFRYIFRLAEIGEALLSFFDLREITLFGLPTTPMIVSAIIGRTADAMNHLVFTMPFLPSEGIPGKIPIKGKLTHVILFRYLPSLWARYPIPNHLRLTWYFKRPEILQFMQKHYDQLGINFLPDHIYRKLSKTNLAELPLGFMPTNFKNFAIEMNSIFLSSIDNLTSFSHYKIDFVSNLFF